MTNEGVFALMLLVSALLGAPFIVCYLREGRRMRVQRVPFYERSLHDISGYCEPETERAA